MELKRLHSLKTCIRQQGGIGGLDRSISRDFPVPTGLTGLVVGGLWLITAEMFPVLPPITTSSEKAALS